MKRTSLLLSGFCASFLFAVPVQAATFVVARDGSGTYNCDGNADQVQINQALTAAAASPGSVVHLKSGRYVLSDTITIGDSTTLEGETGTVLTFAESFWPYGSSNDALIENNARSSSQGKNTIVLRNFDIDGDYNDDTRGDGGKLYGKGRRNFINLSYNNVEIYNMHWYNSPGDGVKVRHSDNVKIHDLRIDSLGHDGIVLVDCHNGDLYKNHIKNRVNAGIRLFGSGFVAIHDNYIYGANDHPSPGGPGLELQRGVQGGDLHDLEVYNNFIYNVCQAGIQLIAFDDPSYTRDQVKNIHIHHNLIVSSGWHGSYDWMAGIVTGGFYNVVIESNTLDGNYGGGIVYLETQGLQSNGTSGKYDVHIRNNIVTNSVRRKGNKSGSIGAGDYTQSGQGIINYNPAEANLYLENNLVYGNVGGSYKNVSSSSDISADPLFADAAGRDYHLKSRAGRWDPAANRWVTDAVSSPGIDGGLASSPFANEPQNNGGRINVGRYGNTSQASLTGSVPQAAMPPAPAEEDFGGEFLPDAGSGSGTGSGGGVPSQNTGGENYQLNLPGGRASDPAGRGGDAAVDPLYTKPDSIDNRACVSVAGSAGLIPCGKSTDDPNTANNECAPCDMRSFLLMGQLIIEFMLKLSGVTAALVLVAGGYAYIFAAGKPEKAKQAKSIITSTLIGFVVVFVAWAIVDGILTTLGYIDPLDGVWHVI